jgi:hypothetical protein
MSLNENILERLQAPRGDVQAQAAVMAEFLLSSRPEDERQPLREAMDAAAILHWFDAHLLHQVLEIPLEDASSRFERLKTLHFVELSGRGASRTHNVHEATLSCAALFGTQMPR